MTTHFAPAAADRNWTTGNTVLLDRMIPGATPVMRAMKRLIAQMAPTDAPVLITGPSGAGKELAAEALHRLSGRSGAFVAVNCAAIPAELLEGELFGSERGAYTGADKARAGLIEQAEGGTLFLDEIGDMPNALQAKLLRVLETRMVRRLGSGQQVQMDFRLVAATHRDLAAEARAGRFREDLFYRLSVFPVAVPALADRLADLPVVLDRMLDDYAVANPGLPTPEFDATALKAMAGYQWPGNLRELRSIVLRACLLFPGGRVGAREMRENLMSFNSPELGSATAAWAEAPQSDAPGLGEQDQIRPPAADVSKDLDLRRYLRDIEVALINAALDQTGRCVSRAADRLRLRRTTLIAKIRKYGLDHAA